MTKQIACNIIVHALGARDMKINFREALNNPGKKFEDVFEWDFDNKFLEYMPHKKTGIGEVRLNYFSSDDGVIDLNIEFRQPYLFVCDKCGDTFEKNLYIVTNEKIYKDGVDNFVYDSNLELNISEVLNQIITPLFPQQVLCKSDCKGVCTKCGANLNYEKCTCCDSGAGQNNPFGQLLGKL